MAARAWWNSYSSIFASCSSIAGSFPSEFEVRTASARSASPPINTINAVVTSQEISKEMPASPRAAASKKAPTLHSRKALFPLDR